VTDEESALKEVLRPRFDARATAVIEHPIRALGRSSTGPAGSARVVETQPERVEVEATARRAGMLVLSDVYYPGWQATVDGRPAKIERVQYLLRAVLVGRGRHHVTFAYRPATFRVGLLISLLALLGLAAVALRAFRRGDRRYS
jgi:uncharacterized membrane protein YfhO